MPTRLLVPVCFLFSGLLSAQDVVVPMSVVAAKASVGYVVPLPATPGVVYAPGEVKVESMQAATGCNIRVQDGEPIALKKDESRTVSVRRRGRELAYEAGCHARVLDGRTAWFLSWAADYKAQGTLKVGDCSRLMTVTDLNGDGIFDSKDLNGSTMLGIDANGDGKISGKSEHVSGAEVFELCGKRWELTEMNPAGEWLKLRESRVDVAKVGAKVPQFSLQMENGTTVNSRQLTGKWNVIDFWASWCVPCMEKLPKLRELGAEMGDHLGIYIYNVDEAETLSQAKQKMLQLNLPFPKGWSGHGVEDPVWKIFGSMPDEHFGVPLYVVIDPQNRIAAVVRELGDVKNAVLNSH